MSPNRSSKSSQKVDQDLHKVPGSTTESVKRDVSEIKRYLGSSQRSKLMLRQNVLLILSKISKTDLRTKFCNEIETLKTVARQLKPEKIAENFIEACDEILT